MSDKDKKRAMIGAAIIAALVILYLLLRGKAGNTVINQSGGATSLGDVFMPGLNFGERAPFVVPDFGYQPESLSAIGACCVDCGSSSAPRTSYAPASPGVTLVYNAGAQGPNVYNYYAPEPPKPVYRVWASSR